MKSKKVIIFIVEGISDKESLNGILSEFYEQSEFVFVVINGDITTDYGCKVDNISSKIVSYIKDAMKKKNKFYKKDIKRVVHIVDMDGAYIPDNNIVFDDCDKIMYTTNNIKTKDVEKVKDRNMRKRNIINKLSSMNYIYGKIPYTMFYMSCNLEHVLHNLQNVSDEKKFKLASEIEDKYIDNPEEFVEFLKNSEFAVKGSLAETWKYIKKDLNSLQRHSNLRIFFEEEN